MSKFGKKFQIELLGTSHGPNISIEMKGIPTGFTIDLNRLNQFMSRRSAINDNLSTSRKEEDKVVFTYGVEKDFLDNLVVTEKKVKAHIDNLDVDSSSYEDFSVLPRPSHADFAAIMKDGEDVEIAGGGRFSGRLTVGLTVAGGIASQILENMGISLKTKLIEVGGEKDPSLFDYVIESAKYDGDSVGGVVECEVDGLFPGSCGDSYFDGLEGKLAEACFAVPAVKGVEFGSGFNGAKLRGSENNDNFILDDNGNIVTETNNHGGILGGIASGMPIVLRCAFKPTPSIAKPQRTVNLITGYEEEIRINGRHDPCVARRGSVVIEAVVAIAILDSLMEAKEYRSKFEEARSIIDEQNEIILEAFEKRMKASITIGKIKEREGLPIEDKAREKEILDSIARDANPEFANYSIALFKELMSLSKMLQKGEEIPNEEDLVILKDNMKCGLLGRTLSHSFSPKIHREISEKTGIDYSYSLFEVEPDRLKEFILVKDFDGINVTIPYKKDVIPYLDELTQSADEIGAVNTIINDNGRLIGDNTDYLGIIHTFKKQQVDVAGKKCLILGAGGGAKAAYYAMKVLGAKNIVILSHNDIDSGKIEEHMDSDILINATSVGMYPITDVALTNPALFFNLKFVFDLIYNPSSTKLISLAKEAGIRCASGLDMLVTQAVCSAEKFFGINLEGLADVIYQDMILENQNIILIGMPGSGKTAIGQELSNILDKEFYDTDEMIEYRTDKTCSEIIKEEGENAFRKYESDAISVLSNAENAVIATGGGVVLSTENYDNLAKNGFFVYITKDLDKLDVSDRPLSEKFGVERLYLERHHKYESWADITVNIDNESPLESAKEIIKKIKNR